MWRWRKWNIFLQSDLYRKVVFYKLQMWILVDFLTGDKDHIMAGEWNCVMRASRRWGRQRRDEALWSLRSACVTCSHHMPELLGDLGGDRSTSVCLYLLPDFIHRWELTVLYWLNSSVLTALCPMQASVNLWACLWGVGGNIEHMHTLYTYWTFYQNWISFTGQPIGFSPTGYLWFEKWERGKLTGCHADLLQLW